jgi:D-aminopeptidase
VDGTTELVMGEVDEVDWLRGTVACAWGLPPGSRAGDHPEVIAVKDHVGRLAAVHPSMVEVSEDLRSARAASRPGQRYAVDVVRVSDKVTVRSVDAG